MSSDRAYMTRAIELASRALGRTFPNPLVGAVVVSGGRVVAEAFHEGAGLPHAEATAIEAAGEKAAGSTLYLNLEPCCHYGRTPPCTKAIIESGISRVVFSIYDPDPRVSGKGARVLRENGVSAESGLMAGEALELNLPYVHSKVTGRPFIILKLALTLDGRLTAPDGRWITGEESRRYVHYTRSAMEAVAVGRGTLEADDPILDRRLFDPEIPPPVRIVFDSGLSFPPGHSWVEGGGKVIVYCSEDSLKERGEVLEESGIEAVALPSSPLGLDLSAWVDDLTSRGITSVLIEGGGKIAESVVRDGVFDRLMLFHAPIFSGRGEPVWGGKDVVSDWFSRGELFLSDIWRIEDDTVAIYDRKHIRTYPEILREGDR